MSAELMALVKGIPQRVERQVTLFKATGGYVFMHRFKASEVEVRQAAEKARMALCMLQLRLAVAEDLLKNTSFINRRLETYEDRVRELLAELAAPGGEREAVERAAAVEEGKEGDGG